MSLTINFITGKLALRQRQGIGFRDPLARALGIKSQKPLRIIDATAGLGRDAFIMASLGCSVTLLERSPVVFAALSEALKQAAENPNLSALINRMSLQQANSIDYISQLNLSTEKIDVIYLDPMYPATNKSALVKKEMRELRELVGDDKDVEALFQAAMNTAVTRVVVKRHRHAPSISGSKPTHVILTKLLRFDVYIKK
jgi:16S rRNA (guanine1516-N2)-methyltransferase